jgi:hypothetical protein
MREFFLGNESAVALIGWHLAVFITFCTGWYIAYRYHHKHGSDRCYRFDCPHRIVCPHAEGMSEASRNDQNLYRGRIRPSGDFHDWIYKFLSRTPAK